MVANTHFVTASYQYDFSGRRISKTVNGVTTHFLYDGDLLIAEMDSAGTVLKSYWWGAFGLVNDTAPLYGGGFGPRFYVFDPQGNSRKLIDKNGVSQGGTGYGPFGTLNPYDGFQPDTPLKWQGQEGCYTDSESGLVYMRHRYYAPNLGRFISRDPIGFDGDINLYGYAAGDPINLTDPDGTDSRGATMRAHENEIMSLEAFRHRQQQIYAQWERDQWRAWSRGEGGWEWFDLLTSITPGGGAKKVAAKAGPKVVQRVIGFLTSLWAKLRNPAKAASNPGAVAATANAASNCNTRTLAEWLKDHPALLQEVRDLFQSSPEWWGCDPDSDLVSYTSQEAVLQIRSKEKGGGHHPWGLALGGPAGQSRTYTGDTTTYRNPEHKRITALQKHIIRIIKKQIK